MAMAIYKVGGPMQEEVMKSSPERTTANTHLTGAQSLARSIQLLRLVAGSNRTGLRLVDATRQSGLTRSTTHRLMQALEHEGLIEQDPDTERYYLGVEAYVLGVAAEERFGLVEASLPSVAKLAELSGDTCLLQIRRGDDSVCVARDEGNFPIRTHTANPGDRHPLGVGAGGLAMLSTLEDDEIERIIGRRTITLRDRYRMTPDLIFEAVEETRARGYGLNPGLVFPESWAIGVPLIDSHGRCRASLALAGIKPRIASPRAEELARMLKKIGVECVAQWNDHPRYSR